MNGPPRGFFARLAARCDQAESSLCVGLDPDPRRMPTFIGSGPEGIYRFCAEIVEATADYAAAFKPNLAFFEAIGTEGWHVLAQVLERVNRQIPIIIDAKRGDIGSTAVHYARALFDRLKADAVTVTPWLGYDSIEPFLRYEDRGVYVLCLTSNKGAEDFQLPHKTYLRVVEKVLRWNRGNLGLVVGATKPEQMVEIRAAAPELPILIPGLGAQGGDLDELMTSARQTPRHCLLFNVSRSILFASQGSDFGRAARKAAQFYWDRINRARTRTLHD